MKLKQNEETINWSINGFKQRLNKFTGDGFMAASYHTKTDAVSLGHEVPEQSIPRWCFSKHMPCHWVNYLLNWTFNVVKYGSCSTLKVHAIENDKQGCLSELTTCLLFSVYKPKTCT